MYYDFNVCMRSKFKVRIPLSFELMRIQKLDLVLVMPEEVILRLFWCCVNV